MKRPTAGAAASLGRHTGHEGLSGLIPSVIPLWEIADLDIQSTISNPGTSIEPSSRARIPPLERFTNGWPTRARPALMPSEGGTRRRAGSGCDRVPAWASVPRCASGEHESTSRACLVPSSSVNRSRESATVNGPVCRESLPYPHLVLAASAQVDLSHHRCNWTGLPQKKRPVLTEEPGKPTVFPVVTPNLAPTLGMAKVPLVEIAVPSPTPGGSFQAAVPLKSEKSTPGRVSKLFHSLLRPVIDSPTDGPSPHDFHCSARRPPSPPCRRRCIGPSWMFPCSLTESCR